MILLLQDGLPAHPGSLWLVVQPSLAWTSWKPTMFQNQLKDPAGFMFISVLLVVKWNDPTFYLEIPCNNPRLIEYLFNENSPTKIWLYHFLADFDYKTNAVIVTLHALICYEICVKVLNTHYSSSQALFRSVYVSLLKLSGMRRTFWLRLEHFSGIDCYYGLISQHVLTPNSLHICLVRTFWRHFLKHRVPL